MSETPGGPEYYTPPPQAAPTPPPPPSIVDAAAQYENPYTAAPGARVPPPLAAPVAYPGAPRPSQGLAITALVVGVVAIFTGWIPGWGILLGVIAVIFGIVAIAKKQSKGMSITGIITGALGALMSIGVIIALVAGASWISDPDNWMSYSPYPDDFVNSDGVPLGPESVDGGLAVTETAFGRASWDENAWWYVVVLDNPGAAPYDGADITIEALNAAGDVVDSSWTWVGLPTGETAISGSFFEAGSEEIASLAVTGPGADGASTDAPAGEWQVVDVKATSDDWSTSVSGGVTSTFPADTYYGATVTVVARDASGEIVAVATSYVDAPTGPDAEPWDAYFFEVLPADTTFDAHVSAY